MATAKDTNKPKGNIKDLQSQVSSIFVSKNSLTKEQAKRVNEYIFDIAKKAGVDGAEFKVYSSETGAVLRMMVDQGMVGDERAKGVFYKNGVKKEVLANDAYLQVLAGAVVTGFAQKSQDLTPQQKATIATNIHKQINGNFMGHSDWEKYYNSCTSKDNIDKAKNPTFRGNIANGTLRVGLGVLTFSGLVASVKAIFNPPQDGERKTFWQQVGNIAKAAGFAFVAYNMVYKGRGVGETIDNTRQTIGQWTGYVNKRQEKAHQIAFSPSPP